MQPIRHSPSASVLACFQSLFFERLPARQLDRWWQQARALIRREPLLPFSQLLCALVYHGLMASGTLQTHVEELLGQHLSGSALSQRRQRLPWQLFERILSVALRPRAEPGQHPQAFYQGLRLVGLDGTGFAAANTPQIVRTLGKAASRRFRAAFARVKLTALVELGLHNPIAAAIGRNGESEYALAQRLLGQLPPGSLLLADRLYGLPAFVLDLLACCRAVGGEFLVRVRRNLQTQVVRRLADGSALVSARSARRKGQPQQTIVLREIQGRVRTRAGRWVAVRLWTSLLDVRRHPARELLALYAQRWEMELTVEEWKVTMQGGERLASYTVETAAQEIAALLLAHAVLVEVRCAASERAKIEVLRISFGTTLRLVQALWSILEIGAGLHSPAQEQALVERTLQAIAKAAIAKRRSRSCPRAVRQTMTAWPRLIRRREAHGEFQYQVIPHGKS